MGFKDVNWAYSLDLPTTQKVVLAAICQRTDDTTHTTLVGQQTVAEMVGMSVRSVHRAIGALDDLGILVRESRRGRGGYRTSDSITVNTAYVPESHLTRSQVTEGHVTESPVLHDTVSVPTCHPVHSHLTQCHDDGQSACQPEGQPEGQPVNALDLLIEPPTDEALEPKPVDRFDEFYAVWPKKKDKPAASRAWAKAIKRASPEEIIAAATAYRDNPFITTKQFIPNPATWLNGDRWADELDGPRQHHNKPASDAKIANLLDRGRHLQALEARKELTS